MSPTISCMSQQSGTGVSPVVFCPKWHGRLARGIMAGPPMPRINFFLNTKLEWIMLPHGSDSSNGLNGSFASRADNLCCGASFEKDYAKRSRYSGYIG